MLLFLLAPVPFSVRFLSYGHPKEFIIALLLGVCVFLAVAQGARPQRALLGLGAAGLAMLLRAESRFFCMWLGGMALLACAVGGIAPHPQWRARVDAAFVAGALLVALLALGQYAGLLTALFPVNPHYSQRMYSVFGNQDLLGGYMAMALALLWARPEWGRGARGFPLTLLAQAAIVAALGLSGSRSAWLAAIVGMALACVLRPSGRAVQARHGAVLAVLAAVIAWQAWPETGARLLGTFSPADSGGNIRLWIWDGALRMWAEYKVAGAGFGSFGFHAPRFMGDALHSPWGARYPSNDLWTEHAHSEPLNLLTQGGALLTVMVLIALWQTLRRARRRAALAPLAALAVFALFNDALHSLPHAIAGMWWLCCAVAVQPGESAECAARQPGVPVLAVAGLAAVGLPLLHFWLVLAPSWRLVQAEDLAMAGRDPVAAYERCTSGAFRYEAWLGLATWHVEQEDWPRAREALEHAAQGLDYPVVHWLRGLVAHRLGDSVTACEALRECLYRNPGNAPARVLLTERCGQ